MSDKGQSAHHDSVGGWAKRLYFASRALMDTVLRPYDLGSTQWYVLAHLAGRPYLQRDLVRVLQVERATLSSIVSTLVRKGLVEQIPDTQDQRQRMLRLTPSGKRLWKALPDPAQLILSIAFDGADEADMAVARRVLQAATERLQHHIAERK